MSRRDFHGSHSSLCLPFEHVMCCCIGVVEIGRKNERRGQMGDTPASYSEGLEFKSRPGDRLS
jgi:hypothetical protein